VKRAQKIYEFICQAEEVLAGILLVAVVTVIFIAAVGRTMGHPVRWGMDMATFLFAWTAFFSADAAMRRDKHVSVDFFVERLSENAQYFIKLLNYFIILAFLAFLIGYGSWLSYYTRFRAFQGIPGFSYMWATLSVPVGSALVFITTVLQIRRLMRARRETSLAKEEAS
jgi:TRAP-type C4-dicarboxylate transport system permease small subunit